MSKLRRRVLTSKPACLQVMIFDFDVHHGNGTHDIFYDDPLVLFVSTHQSGSYPGTGALREVGSGAGEGASINLPLPGVANAVLAPLLASGVTVAEVGIFYGSDALLVRSYLRMIAGTLHMQSFRSSRC